MKTKNKYAYPVKLSDNVRMAYSESPAHKDRLQYAVDFITKEGTPIIAALGGIVVDIKQDSETGGPTPDFDKFGNYIEIRHPNGEYSIYEHIKCAGSLVNVGDEVKTGQIIGYSGDTGWVAHLGPHLHFDVHTYPGSVPEGYDTLEICWRTS